MDNDTPVTDLLGEWSGGDRQALDDLMTLVYGELKEQCRRAMARERASHTLEPTALLNEVYLRLVGLKRSEWENRTAFFAFAVRLMRRILVEHAREVGAQKRGGQAQRVDLDFDVLPVSSGSVDVLDLDQLLSALEEHDPFLVKLIELRFFAGMTEREMAEALSVSRSKVQREWRVGKRLLARALEGKRGTDKMD